MIFSLALSVIGLGIVATTSNLLAAFLTLMTLISYNVIYTPMKRRSQLATLVGAVPGSAAADDRMGRRYRRAHARSLGTLRDRVRLADSALHGHRVALSRRLRTRRFSAAARRRAGRQEHGTARGAVCAGAGSGQPGAVFPSDERRGVRRRRRSPVASRCWRSRFRSRCSEPTSARGGCFSDRSPICRCCGRC